VEEGPVTGDGQLRVLYEIQSHLLSVYKNLSVAALATRQCVKHCIEFSFFFFFRDGSETEQSSTAFVHSRHSMFSDI
jgi:hypothetical protein